MLTIFILLLGISLILPVMSSDVVDLTSSSFEHDTQASTGSTTGDWFVDVSIASNYEYI